MEMAIYSRTFTRREKINRFGKLGFNAYCQFFLTDDEEFIKECNKGKRVKFAPLTKWGDLGLLESADNIRFNTVYEFNIKKTNLVYMVKL